MAPKAKRSAQKPLTSAGFWPLLPKTNVAIGKFVSVPGKFWEGCPSADKGALARRGRGGPRDHDEPERRQAHCMGATAPLSKARANRECAESNQALLRASLTPRHTRRSPVQF